MGGITPFETAGHLKPDHALYVTITAEPDNPRQLVRNVLVSGRDYYLRRTEGKADQPIRPVRGAWQRPEAIERGSNRREGSFGLQP